MKTAIFSGRFDPPHLGHVLTILKILHPEKVVTSYNRVVIVILDYHERQVCDAQKAMNIFHAVFSQISKCATITLLINKEHFGKITLAEYMNVLKIADVKEEDAVYVSGNDEVLKHIKDIGIPYHRIERSEDYSGTHEREIMRRENLTIDQYLKEVE